MAPRSGSKPPGAATRAPGKRASVQAQLAVLEATVNDASSAEAHATLREAIRTGPGLVAARAARIVRERGLAGFDDDLIGLSRQVGRPRGAGLRQSRRRRDLSRGDEDLPAGARVGTAGGHRERRPCAG